MRRRTLIQFGMGIGLGVFSSLCHGGSVKATQDNPDATVFSTGGYMNVAAYSDEVGVGVNLVVTPTVTFGGGPAMTPSQYKFGVGVTSTKIYVPNGKLFLGPVAQVIGPNGLALTKNLLTAVGNTDTIVSQTGGWIGTGSVTNTSLPNRGKYTVSASAVSGDPVGHSAALAGDPIDIPTGSYSYDPDINVTLDVDAGESGDARVYAEDASTFTTDDVENFQLDGAPLANTLWSLVMQATSPSSSTSNVQVDFELNPVALSEITFPSSYVSSLGSYSDPTSEAALIDTSMDNAIAADESFSGDTDSLTDVDPFPSGTMFAPATNGEEYGDGVDAEIQDVPEPATMGLMVVAASTALGLRKRR